MKSLFKKAIFYSLLSIMVTACHHEKSVQTSMGNVVSVGTKVPSYSFSEMNGFSPFKAKILYKNISIYDGSLIGIAPKTNYCIILFLKNEDGDNLFAIDKRASDDTIRAVHLLEENHSYIFPYALTNETQ